MENLGDKIYFLRKKYNMTQQELGERVGVTRQTVSLWEANRLQIKSDKLKQICEVFHVSSQQMLFEEAEIFEEQENSINKDVIEPAEADLKQKGKTEKRLNIKINLVVILSFFAVALGIIGIILNISKF